MSNCITIEMKKSVTFKPNEIDAVGLYKLIKEAEEKIKSGKDAVQDNIDPKYKIAWWFLAQNTEFKRTGSVVIHFGEGRSSHTNRDFRATIYYLKDFVLKDKWHRFWISDEYDNYESICETCVNFKTEEIR